MRIIFFTKGDAKTGSSRQRAFLMAEHLKHLDIDARVYKIGTEEISKTPWPKKFFILIKIFRDIFSFRKNDVIVLQRAIYNKYFIFIVLIWHNITHRPLIFDFDDAIYLHSYLKTKLFTKISSAVTVGSHALADWALQYNTQVYLIPTVVDEKIYTPSVKNINNTFVIGWVGNGPAHLENLKILPTILQSITSTAVSIKFVLVGGLNSNEIHAMFSNLKNIEVQIIDSLDWSNPSNVVSIIQTFDVGLLPLIDSEWNKGKCAFKGVEYIACGVPCIASPVGENRWLITDGVDGFLPKNDNQWIDKINLLIQNQSLREKLSKAARHTFEQRYSYTAVAPIFKDIIQHLFHNS